MNSKVNIVPAERKDLPVISLLAPDIWRHAYCGILSDEQISYMLDMMYAPEKLEAAFDSGTVFRLVEHDGDTAGFFACYELPDDRTVLKLDKLYLKPEFHGRGIGSFVLEYLTGCASDAGYAKLTLNVNKANAKAIKVYTKNGFKKKQSVRIDIGSGFFMDDHIMEKKLI